MEENLSDLDLIRAIIADELPGCDIGSVSRFQHGFVNRNYEVSLLGARCEKIVVRLYRSRPYAHRIQVVTQVMQLLGARTNIPTPRIIALAPEDSRVGVPYLVMTRIPGDNLEHLLPSLSTEQQQEIGCQIGRHLREMHAIRMDCYGAPDPSNLQKPVTEKAWVLARLQRLLEECEAHALLPAPDLPRLADFLLGHMNLCSDEQPVLVHGDFHPENMMVDVSGDGVAVTGLLDFEQCVGWRPEIDVLKLLGSHNGGYPELMRGFLHGYGVAPGLRPSDLLHSARARFLNAVVDLTVFVEMAHVATGPLIDLMIRQRHRSIALRHFDRLFGLLDELAGSSAAHPDRPSVER